jgi:hypothetical protein
MGKKNKKEERIGEIGFNKFNTEMKIIEYKDANHIIVEFQDECKYRTKTNYNSFKKGEVKNIYDKTIFSIGYLGKGLYNIDKNKNIYKKWQSMLQRCYDPYYINKNLTYKDCFVCEEWHCFQNFCKWWEEHVYDCNGEEMHLDKDILIKRNKIYSPETCLIVPKRINELFTKSDANRGKYPIGVNYHKRDEVYEANCSVLDENRKKKKIYLGRFNNELDAFLAYKIFKENYIKQVAEEYKDLIPQKLYEALYRYKVEIND